MERNARRGYLDTIPAIPPLRNSTEADVLALNPAVGISNLAMQGGPESVLGVLGGGGGYYVDYHCLRGRAYVMTLTAKANGSATPGQNRDVETKDLR